MLDVHVHVNKPDVAGFIVHSQYTAEAFSMAPAQVRTAHKILSIITILILMSYYIFLWKRYLTF